MQKGTGLNLGLRYVPESTAQGIRRLPEHQQAQIVGERRHVAQRIRVAGERVVKAEGSGTAYVSTTYNGISYQCIVRCHLH